ncbi:bifunctional diguanylate cyclase/phosphodiesterase [Roseateles sp. DAIF2]|uniref:putative bifunctional diguanylate cyclase/phosphodiesterase n=1 Tax=Roseateles sp. DAIF2 TaxID=2714952 RepID=UPI0018A28649|nr:bifunctional diguanylate cyclase/phosphodiesterase [Roseateles sp. DAIF2]QPF74268.1 bifunctional diguanylate cyclase/phosphodiesterase [Roseateles sp. DAIF2]
MLSSLVSRSLLQAAYLAALLVILLVLKTHPDPFWRVLYLLLLPPLLLLARFAPSARNRAGCAGAAALLLLGGGLISPMPVDAIESGFLLLPLLYLMLYPGRWPAPVLALLLVLSYWIHSPAGDHAELLEDALELLVITGFATVMSHYYLRTRQQMEDYRKDSLTDYLTRLPNRQAYATALHQLDALPPEARQQHALLLVDLDNFKRINDLYGHQHGDLLLRQFAQRLEVLPAGRAYRIGGDEFAVLLPSGGAASATELARFVQTASRAPYQLLNRQLESSVSIGVAQCDAHCQHSSLLARNADLALYQAKALGKNETVHYHPALLGARELQDRLERDLLPALAAGQFFLLYQPQVDLRTLRITGAEALVRWRHPELGLISPGRFIALAESTRQIIPLGAWVLEQACRQARSWAQAGVTLKLSVNISPVQLEQEQMLDGIRKALRDAALAPQQLQVEITETSMVADLDNVQPALQRLRSEGVQVAVDDFGVAYSSLSQLTRLPLDVLKIDKSFVDHCHENQPARMLVRTIIQLAHNLQLGVVAEGVEQEAQRQVLLEEGCGFAQGYLFHRPLEAAALGELLRQQQGLPEA